MKNSRKIHEYALYDIDDNYLILGLFTRDELAKRFQTTKEVISYNVSRHQPKDGRYMIEKI